MTRRSARLPWVKVDFDLTVVQARRMSAARRDGAPSGIPGRDENLHWYVELLGRLRREIGPLQQSLGIGTVIGVYRDPDRRSTSSVSESKTIGRCRAVRSSAAVPAPPPRPATGP